VVIYGLSAFNISNLANGALGEHRRHDTDGLRLEIEPAACRHVAFLAEAGGDAKTCAKLILETWTWF
jgi:hypothetical protein